MFDVDVFVRWMKQSESRLLTLERMARAAAGRAVRFFTDLEDVPPFSQITEPGAGEVTVWAVDRTDTPVWVPVNIGDGSGSGGSPYASIRVDHDGTAGTTTMVWNAYSDAAYELVATTSGGARGCTVTAAGIYQVHGNMVTTGSTPRVEVNGDSFEGIGDVCVPNYIVSRSTGTGFGASASGLFALPPGGQIWVSAGPATYAWALTVALVHPLAVVDDACAA